jgi:hypothetical protein
MLTGAHKTQRMTSALTFLKRYHEDGDEFLSHVIQVTGDETFMNVETKAQSKQWMYTHPPNNLEKLEQTSACQKADGTYFWGRKGVLIVEFMKQGTTIMLEEYCKTLQK